MVHQTFVEYRKSEEVDHCICEDDDYEKTKEEKFLELYQDCDVDLEITLQIWNIDDRFMQNTSDKQRPITEFNILKIRE